MRKILIVLPILLFLLSGCLQPPAEDVNADEKPDVSGDKLILSHSIKNPDGTETGIQKDGDVYTINMDQSASQKISIIIGNRLEREVLVRETDFACRGKNLEGSSAVGVETLDYFFECVNCVYKETCSLESNEILDSVPDCLLNRGKRLVRIEKGSGLEFTALIKPVELVEAKMDCAFFIRIFDVKDEQFSTAFSINYSG